MSVLLDNDKCKKGNEAHIQHSVHSKAGQCIIGANVYDSAGMICTVSHKNVLNASRNLGCVKLLRCPKPSWRFFVVALFTSFAPFAVLTSFASCVRRNVPLKKRCKNVLKNAILPIARIRTGDLCGPRFMVANCELPASLPRIINKMT